MSSKLLINESPILVLPTLANIVGLNESIVLQQLHFWLQNKTMGKTIDGVKWFRNTLADWQEHNFEFWSESTIYRIFNKLEEKEIVNSRTDLNAMGYDRTKWYTINYDVLNSLIDEKPILQNDEIHLVKLQNGSSQNEITIPKNTSKNTSKKDSNSNELEQATLFKQSEPILESKSEQEIIDEMSAVGVIDLMDLLSENNDPESTLIADKNHPAIIAWREVNNRYPKKQTWEYIADNIGVNPDIDVLKYVCAKWIATGYNPTNIDGQLNWYKQALHWYSNGYELDDWQPKWKNQDNELPNSLRGLKFD